MRNDFFRPRSGIAQAIYDKMVVVQGNRQKDDNWIVNELNALWEETNKQSMMLGKGPVLFESVKQAEQCAQGHIDYLLKCSYYCQKLAMGDKLTMEDKFL